MWLIYFDASFNNFKIGKICWNSSRIWTQIPHKWYWNHPLLAFREVFLVSFYGLRVEWEMSARSDSAGEARPLLPLICVHQFRPTLGTDPCSSLLHCWIPEQIPHLHSISCSSGPAATPGAPNTELLGSKTLCVLWGENGDDGIWGGCWRGSSPWPTYTNQPRVLSQQSLSKTME